MQDVYRERGLQEAQNGALDGRPLRRWQRAADHGLHQPVHLDAVAVATHQGVAVQGSQRPVTPYRISQHLVQRPGQDRRLLICQNGHRKRIGREERHVLEELYGGYVVLLELVEGDLPGRVQQHVVGDRTLAEQLLAGGPEQLQVATGGPAPAGGLGESGAGQHGSELLPAEAAKLAIPA